MNLISWNCCGLENPRTVHDICQLVKDKRPRILFVMDTEIQRNRFSYLRSKLGFERMFMVDCVGCSGSLALLWKEEVELEIQNYSIRHINVVIKSEGMDFH